MEHPVLFAHNARKFDSLIFVRSVLKSGKVEREKIICGFSDTLQMLKNMHLDPMLTFLWRLW